MTTIKRYGLLAAGILLIVGALAIGAAALPALAQANQRNGNYTGPGAGMMGSNWGGGMMGGGSGGMMGGTQGNPSNPNATRLSGDQVRQAVTNYLNSNYSGQSLSVDEIMEFQNNFYVQIKEPSTGVNAFELLVDPYSGSVWPEYGPNMMWNTKYGHMGAGSGNGGMMGGGMMGGGSGGMMGGYSRSTQPTANMPVTPRQAVQDAQQYLKDQGSALTVESQPDVFYGYYTIDTLKDGKTQGMLSVNGYTGQVWLHTWHGTFIGMVGQQ